MIKSIITYIVLTRLPTSSGHGFMTQPAAIYNDPPTKTTYIYRVDGNIIFPGLKWNDSPQKNSDQLTQKINQGQFPDLKSFTNKYVNGCPFNDLSKSIDVNSLNIFQWQNDEERKGFVESHEGPCEIWIDSIKIFNDTNCARKYTNYPAVLPIDYSICKGTCQFEFYWMAMQEPLWQLYKGCATITRTQSDQSPTIVPTTAPTQSSTPSPTLAPVSSQSPTIVPTPAPASTQSSSIKLVCSQVD